MNVIITIRKSAILLTTGLFIVSSVLTGCEDKTKNQGKVSSNISNEPLKIDILDNAANYQGEQTGWFGQIVKKKFNLTLNILAPSVSGDSLYKTRSASGDLGDLVILDNSQLKDCIKSGLVMDMSGMINDYPNLKKFYNHFEYFNANFDKKVNPKGLIYGLPTNEADTSPTSFSQFIPYSSPLLPWDYYSGVGSPTMNNLNDLLDTLKKMQDKYPKNVNGKPIHAITLWKDWDGYIMENARWLCNWYGYEEPSETSSVLLNADGKVQPITDDNGMYHKILKFLYDANKMGLIDPESASQNWNMVSEKLANKQVDLLWYNWETGFYNTNERGQNKDGNIAVPISDLHIIQEGDAYYGDGRVFAIGSKAKNPKMIMKFLDWFVSPEGMRYVIDGIEGFNYTKQADGKLEYTSKGQAAFTNNLPVPAEYGGGGYKDGMSAINTLLIGEFAKDPDTGEFYNYHYWNSTIEANKTALTNEWTQKYQAQNAVDYYKKHNMIDIVPNINVNFETDSSDISNKRSQCKELVIDTSWKMVFAKNENEFNELWEKMKNGLESDGWNDLVTADTAKCKVLVDLRDKVSKSAKK
ncbi:MAG: extracellular solute-binding protein [Bacillota bacterium]|nr:extracellular solute-binding protein [Bacillota bacterium]